MNYIKLTTFILLLPLSSFSQSKNLEINDFFDFKITRYFDYGNDSFANFNFTDSTFTVPEGKLWKINYFGIGIRKNISPWNMIGESTHGDCSVYLDGALIYFFYNYNDSNDPTSSSPLYEKKCPIWLNSGEHKIIIDHKDYGGYDWEMKLNLSIVEFNITEN